jgi:hypothetical protein
MIAEPITRDFIVPQGVTYPIKMRWTNAGIPISLTGAAIRAQLRKEYEASTADLDATIANGKAFLDTVDWYFGFTLLPSDTNLLEATTYFYDILVTTAGGDVTRAMQGKITLTPRVTRG